MIDPSLARRATWTRRVAAWTALPAAGVLSGCVSLLPTAPPVQLYQFGQLPPPASADAEPQGRISIALTAVDLPRAALGDQLLTVIGPQAAYIAGVRWVAPAAVLFQADVVRAFAVQSRRVRLLARGEGGVAGALLRLEVGDFETRYDRGPLAAPTVLVSLHAVLSCPDGGSWAERTFTVSDSAADNRLGPIVQAYDRATLQALSQLTAWTDAAAPARAQPPGATAAVASCSPASASLNERLSP